MRLLRHPLRRCFLLHLAIAFAVGLFSLGARAGVPAETLRVAVIGTNPAYERNNITGQITVPEGTVTALFGPSGSGKSTIATLLARFDDPRRPRPAPGRHDHGGEPDGRHRQGQDLPHRRAA